MGALKLDIFKFYTHWLYQNKHYITNFPLPGSDEDNGARRCDQRRSPASATESVVQQQASRARQRGAQHAVAARGHSKTGQTLTMPSVWGDRSALHKSIWLCNVRKLYSCLNFHIVFYFKRYWKRGIFFRRESRKGNRHSRNVLYHYIISAVTYRSSMYRAQGHVHTNDRSTRGNAALERSEGGYCAFAAKPSELLLWPRLSAWLTFHRFLNSSSRCLAKIKYRWTRKNTALEMIPNKMISGNLDAWD